MTLEEYQELKDAVEAHQRKADRAAGVKENILNQLMKEFGCRDIKEAERLLEREKKLLEKKEEKLEEARTEFQEKWGHLLNE